MGQEQQPAHNPQNALHVRAIGGTKSSSHCRPFDRLPELGGETLDLGEAVGDARFALLGADRDAVGGDEFGGDAEEAERGLQIAFGMSNALSSS